MITSIYNDFVPHVIPKTAISYNYYIIYIYILFRSAEDAEIEPSGATN